MDTKEMLEILQLWCEQYMQTFHFAASYCQFAGFNKLYTTLSLIDSTQKKLRLKQFLKIGKHFVQLLTKIDTTLFWDGVVFIENRVTIVVLSQYTNVTNDDRQHYDNSRTVQCSFNVGHFYGRFVPFSLHTTDRICHHIDFLQVQITNVSLSWHIQVNSTTEILQEKCVAFAGLTTWNKTEIK